MAKNKKCDGFFRTFFSSHRKDNEINALRLALRFIRSHPFPPRHTQTPAPRASIPHHHTQTPAPRASFPHRHTQTPAPRASFPPRHLWRGVAERPRVRSRVANRPGVMSHFPVSSSKMKSDVNDRLHSVKASPRLTAF